MADTNRAQLIPLVRDANKSRPAGKKIAIVGRTNEAIAKDLGISISEQSKKAAAGLWDDLEKSASQSSQKAVKKLGVTGSAVQPAAKKMEKAVADSQKKLPPDATPTQRHDAAVGAAKKAMVAIKKDASPPPPKVAVAKSASPPRKPEATGEQARTALARLEAKHKEIVEKMQAKQQDLIAQARIMAQESGPKAAKQFFSEEMETLKQQHSALEEKVLKKAREILYVNNPSKMGVSATGEFDPHTRKPTGKPMSKDRARTYAEGLSEFKKLVGVPSLDGKTLAVAAIADPSGKKDRSYYGGKGDRIHMGSKADKAVVIHEAAHWLEEKDPEVHKKVQAFLDKRTKGEEYQKLSDITGNPNYSDKEVAKADKFMRAYMGKKTGANNSEILSMGLEHMYRDPIGFAKKDPEYFDFIYNLMRGK